MSNSKELIEEKDSKGILVVGNGMDKYNPIGDEMKKSGIRMPDIVATGSLNVESSNIVVLSDGKVLSDEKFDKKKIPLPKIGDKFMLNSHEYIVTYINPGNHRFTCEPCKGVY